MEEWQRKHITQNLSELMRLSEFNIHIKAELLAQNILCKVDVDKLDALETQNGQSEISYHYYHLLMGRINAYKVLTKALLGNHQTGAARILIEGVPNVVSDKPLTHLDIFIKWDGFKDMEIEVNGKKLRLHEFMPTVNYDKLQQIFQDTLSELKIYNFVVMKQSTFVLANNTVPPKPLIYVPRFISNRIKIHESLFKADCPDVFVFKNTIARYKLSQIAMPHFTDTSTSQLTSITCRFIYLDENDDWTELKKIAKTPIHLINFNSDQNHFLLEDTSVALDILKRLGSRKERVYMSEEDFVQQQLSEVCASSSVCISDSPGMGKTFLLANIARLMSENSTGRIVVFIPISLFAKDSFTVSEVTNLKPEASLIKVLGYIGPTRQNVGLLLKLIKSQIIQLEIFFDGFDELPADKCELMKQLFKSIVMFFTNVKIYITSRPHMRQELEESLGVVAYDILPFSLQNQIEFLVKYWQSCDPGYEHLSLQNYATKVLKAVNKSVTKNDKKIAGIPLLCQLIAEVYANNAALHSLRRLSDAPLQMSGMYQKFIEKKINLIAKDKKEFDDIKLVHICYAVNLLLADKNFDKDDQFANIKDSLLSPEILRVGILQKNSPNLALEFLHRTFAEHFFVDYCFTKLRHNRFVNNEAINCNSIAILKLLLENQQNFWNRSKFSHPVIVSFFDASLGENNLSEDLKVLGATFVLSISHTELNHILCSCCRYSLLNIFSFLKESFTNWDKSQIVECFTHDNRYELIRVCIRWSTSQMFRSCIQLLTEVLQLDVAQIDTSGRVYTLLQWAVKSANYEAVEYFLDKVPLKNQSLLRNCVESSDDIEKREHIVHLLLNKDPTLIHENVDVLFTIGIDVRLFKLLVKCGANINVVNENKENCAMFAAGCMSSSDYHELVQFLLTDCRAEYLFHKNAKWEDPLPFIIQYNSLLPETLELLPNVACKDINGKDRWKKLFGYLHLK